MTHFLALKLISLTEKGVKTHRSTMSAQPVTFGVYLLCLDRQNRIVFRISEREHLFFFALLPIAAQPGAFGQTPKGPRRNSPASREAGLCMANKIGKHLQKIGNSDNNRRSSRTSSSSSSSLNSSSVIHVDFPDFDFPPACLPISPIALDAKGMLGSI